MSLENNSPVVAEHEIAAGSRKGYVLGFILSLLFTLTAYALVQKHVSSYHEAFAHSFLYIAIAVMAVAQFFVQMFFFLHLGRETKPRWKLVVFYGMAMTVFIIVAGSLWIMHNLNYRMMPTQAQTDQYLHSQDSM